MIKPEQIPLEVIRDMRVAWARRNNSDAPEKHMADLAVAALNAWPLAFHSNMAGLSDNVGTPSDDVFILPLPKEASDDVG